MNCPLVNEIFGLRFHARGYTIFSKLLTTYQHELWRTSLALREHTKPSEQKKYLCYLLELPDDPTDWLFGV